MKDYSLSECWLPSHLLSLRALPSSEDILSDIAADEEASLALAHQLHAAEESKMQARQTQIAGDAEKMLGIHRCE